MTLARALQVAAGNSQESADVAEAIDFDGTNDYLSRASNLTGNTDGKTLTFSGWIWANSATAQTFYAAGTGPELIIFCDVSGGALNFRVLTTDTTLTTNLSVTSSAGLIPLQTWTHVLLSVDLNNSANRSIYVNDVLISPTWTLYVNSTIDRTFTAYNVANNPSSSTRVKGRLSNVYLDYTYRNLSIEANRRLFVTADLKPAAGQAALNPILYLPMSDPTAPGANAGTGGNFTLTGTVARSGRGPNQYNAPYSDLDGTADFLSRTSVSGIADGKQFTVQWCGSLDANGNRVISIGASTTERFLITMSDGSGRLQIIGRNSSGTEILNAITPSNTIVLGRNYVVTISIDLGNTSNRYVYINGSAVSMTWTTYNTTNDIDFLVTSSPRYRVGYSAADSNFFNGRLGAVWFNTSYIDLSVADNLAKFVTGTGIDAKPVDLGANGELPTGTSPLIYLPMYGNNAGKNYGTGGDFTVNSGPYTGARGPNEYWGNKADFNGTNAYLSRTSALAGVSDSKTFSVSFWVNRDTSTGGFVYRMSTSGGDYIFFIRDNGGTIDIRATSANSGTTVFSVNPAFTLTAGTTYCIQLGVDLADTAKRSIYINGTLATTTYSVYQNIAAGFSTAPNSKFSDNSSYYDGKISEFYFTTEYIDFTQEANRLKFRDAFGNPVDLTQQIEDGAIPNPAIYMRFPPTAFGTNSGTGGNFTVNGTITDGGQL